jgi:cytochrome c553
MNNCLRKTLSSSLLVASAIIGATAFAQDGGDVDRGRELSYTCLGCHGIEGLMNAYPAYHVPKIGGQNAEYIVLALQAYANGDRQHPTMMAQGSSLTEQEMRDIGAYFESANR